MCLLAIFLAPFFLTAQSSPQETDEFVVIKMKNGCIYKGEIINETDEQIELKTAITTILINKKEYKTIANDILGEASRINASKYFHSTTGIPLKPGEISAQNILVFYNRANIGLTKNLSLSAGFELMTLATLDPFYHISPSLTVPIGKHVHVGVGVKAAGFISETYVSSFGKLTIGNSDTNFSISSGINILSPSYYESRQSLTPIEFSGVIKCNDRFSIISENRFWLDNSDDLLTEFVGPKPFYLGIHGVRINYKRSAFDLGFMNWHSFERQFNLLDFIVPLPQLSYSYAFSLGSNKR